MVKSDIKDALETLYIFSRLKCIAFYTLAYAALFCCSAVQCTALHQTLGRLRSGPWGDLGSNPFEIRLLDWLLDWVNLSKRGRRTGFSKGWQGCSEGFPEEQPYQPEESPILPDSFTKIYILFSTCFFKLLRSAGE